MGHSNGSHPSLPVAGTDALLEALAQAREDEPSFATSSAALQAANAVMLANMRQRLATHKKPASQQGDALRMPTQPASAASKPVTTSHSAPIQLVVPLHEDDMTSADISTHTEMAEAAETPISAAPIALADEEIQFLAREEAAMAIEQIAETPETKPHTRDAAMDNDTAQAAQLAITNPEHAHPSVSAPQWNVVEEAQRTIHDFPAISPAQARMGRTPADAAPTASTPEMVQGMTDYTSWHSVNSPSEQRMYAVWLVAALAIAFGINAFFFMRSDTPNARIIAQAAAPASMPNPAPAPRVVADDRTIPTPVPTPMFERLQPAAAAPTEAPRAAMRTPAITAPAATAAEMRADTRTVDPQQLLRVLSRP